MECELPNRNLYDFAGTLEISSAPHPIPLRADQVLLRGSQLKNTSWIYGIVIYSGHDTKLMMVSLKTKNQYLFSLSYKTHFSRIHPLFHLNEPM